MRKFNLILSFIFISMIASSLATAQTVLYADGSSGFCSGFPNGCLPQPNYGVSANNTTGNIFLLKREFSNVNGNFYDKLIKYPGAAARTGEINLRTATYKSVFAESGAGTGVFVFFKIGDSVVVERYNQGTLTKNFSTGIYTGVSSVEAVDMIIAHNCLYIASNDANGLHIRRLNKTTGAIISSVDYNTTFASGEHALDMDATSSGIILAGYLSRPGTIYGDEFWTIKFTVGLSFNWQKRYNNNLSLTNNVDRASRIRVNNDSIYVCGTSTRPSGDVDALLWKYTNTGINRWFKLMNNGSNEYGVDCTIDASNDDVYMLHNFGINSIQTTISTTAGSNVIVVGNTSNLSVGNYVWGPCLTSGSIPAIITSIVGSNVTLSTPATCTSFGLGTFVNDRPKIYVTRYNTNGTFQWIRLYESSDYSPNSSTIGYSIFADPNPGGGGCEVYVSGQRADYGSNTNGQVHGNNYVAYKYNRSGVFTSLVSGNVAANGIAPEVSINQGAYFPNYTGGPILILLGDGQWSNPSPGYWGWNMYVYDISSVARLSNTVNELPNSSLENNVTIIPNPSKDYFKVSCDAPMDVVKVFNISGQLVMELKPSTAEVTISTTGFKKGIYVVQTILNNSTNYSRLVIE